MSAASPASWVLVTPSPDPGRPAGTSVGTGRVDSTVPMRFSGDETTDLGSDTATPVSDDYLPYDSEYNGKVRWVQIDLADAAEDDDHRRCGGPLGLRRVTPFK